LDVDAVATLAGVLAVEFAGASHLEDVLKAIGFD
jgi:hypothetical protein